MRQIQTSYLLANFQMRPCSDFVPQKYSYELNELVMYRFLSFPTQDGANGGGFMPTYTRI